MNSRDQRPMDELDVLIRANLLQGVAARRPAPQTRRRLMARAVEQQSRKRWLAVHLFIQPAPPRLADWENAAWSRVAYFSLLRNLGFAGVSFYQFR